MNERRTKPQTITVPPVGRLRREDFAARLQRYNLGQLVLLREAASGTDRRLIQAQIWRLLGDSEAQIQAKLKEQRR